MVFTRTRHRLHPIVNVTAVLASIGEHIELLGDRCSFSKVSKTFGEASKSGLYRRLNIPISTINKEKEDSDEDDVDTAQRRRKALQRTLANNAPSANIVQCISTALSPSDEVQNILELCPRVQHLQWRISDVDSALQTLELLPLPQVPTSVTHLHVYQDTLLHLTDFKLKDVFSKAANLKQLVLRTPILCVAPILKLIGHQITDL